MSLKFKQNPDGSWTGYSEEQKVETSAPDSSDTKSVARRKKIQKEETAGDED